MSCFALGCPRKCVSAYGGFCGFTTSMFGTLRDVGRRAGRLQASADESGNSWKRSAGLPYYLKLRSGFAAVIDAFKRLVSTACTGLRQRGVFAGLASALHAASSAGPGQRCSSAPSSDVRIAGARNSSQVMHTLPTAPSRQLRARHNQQSARLPVKQSRAAASCGTRG